MLPEELSEHCTNARDPSLFLVNVAEKLLALRSFGCVFNVIDCINIEIQYAIHAYLIIFSQLVVVEYYYLLSIH
jgi:hypothetical protein